ncbi:hypothetical protein DEO72_LG3g1795 [Vigna unguiculata]|uniref:Uncharacterized protein n=1 Tax=Vigna unguiculata TaxID=3917 RepID=A0A4D6LF79_VIGUN|nr:hypothetical protein DEO72_LG3g1795 [Vigna unguiculata]
MAQHLPIQAYHHCHLKATHTSHSLQHNRLAQPQALPSEISADRLAVQAILPGARSTDKMPIVLRPPGRSYPTARRQSLQTPSWSSYRLVRTLTPPGAVSAAYQFVVFTRQSRLSHLLLTPPKQHYTLIHSILIIDSLAPHK